MTFRKNTWMNSRPARLCGLSALALAIFAMTSSYGTGIPASAAGAGGVHYNPNIVLPAPAIGVWYAGMFPEAIPIKRPSGDSTGNFRATCQFSHMNFDDPIVFPSQPNAAHLHTYFGNVGSNAYSTGASLLNSGNSTCDGGILNRSAYWIPSVVDGADRPVSPDYNMIYYKSGYQGVTPDKVIGKLPNGLQLVAGNSNATSSQGEPSYARYVNWSCSSEGWQGRKAYIPDCAEGQEILAEIQFPQCWDGKNLSSADHVSHMTYGQWGVGCPASHPIGIPSISFNIHWKVPAGGTTGWRLASDHYAGGAGGYSLHGDLIMAWDNDVSTAWLWNCVKQNADCNVGQITDSVRLMPGRRS
jgi:Domain of unknown function (DUF1996)